MRPPANRSKKAKWTTLIIIDSQAVKNTCNAGVESKGFCRYKATNGIKRHLAVDTLGFPFFTYCTQANVSDDIGLVKMLTENIAYFKSNPSTLKKSLFCWTTDTTLIIWFKNSKKSILRL